MNVLDEIKQLQSEIESLEQQARQKRKELIEWARLKRSEIKKHFPNLNKMYEITDVSLASKLDNKFSYLDFQNNKVFYFVPKFTNFAPHEDFDYSSFMPTVKGEVLDSNLRKVESLSHFRIEVTLLKNIEANPLDVQNKITKLYVMIDKNTGYYKIGRSVNPRIREKTLQSEKPTIEMLRTYDGMFKDEKALHEMFQEKRIRGEWFDLSGSDIKAIDHYFKQ
jgi:hypothetical protein